MAHAFDTGLTLPQRTLVRDAVIARLSLLKKPALYVETVKPFGRVLGESPGDLLGEINAAFGGYLPAILVSVGRKSYDGPIGLGSNRDRYRADLELQVLFASKHLRGPMARLEQDAVSLASNLADPGLEVMLEHAEELLLGYQLEDTSGTVYHLSPRGEDEIDTGEDYTFWLQTYSVAVDRLVRRHRTPGELVTALRAEYREDGAEPTQNPLITAEHT